MKEFPVQFKGVFVTKTCMKNELKFIKKGLLDTQ